MWAKTLVLELDSLKNGEGAGWLGSAGQTHQVGSKHKLFLCAGPVGGMMRRQSKINQTMGARLAHQL